MRSVIPGVLAFAVLGAIPAARADLNCNAGVEFYPEGGLRACVLNGVHELHTAAGLTVRCADAARAEQFPGGRLRTCVLERALEAGGVRCPAGARVELDPDGRMSACRPV